MQQVLLQLIHPESGISIIRAANSEDGMVIENMSLIGRMMDIAYSISKIKQLAEFVRTIIILISISVKCLHGAIFLPAFLV